MQDRPALIHLHLVQPLGDVELHLLSSLQALAASDIVINTMLKELPYIDHLQSSSEGMLCIACVLVIQTPVWSTEHLTC